MHGLNKYETEILAKLRSEMNCALRNSDQSAAASIRTRASKWMRANKARRVLRRIVLQTVKGMHSKPTLKTT